MNIEDEFGSSSFIVRSPEGVFVDLSMLESSSQFALFAARVFSSGYHFAALDYATFLELLSDYTPEKLSVAVSRIQATGKAATVRFASDILALAPERIALYRAPRMISGTAEYLFEPVMIEKTVEEPLFAETEGGAMEIVGTEQRVISEKTALIFDEFVAAMWMRGIRYGIDFATVQEFMRTGKSGRVVFARPLLPRGGRDSNLKEETDRLYRDNAPRELSGGKVDLKQFKNRFPQIRQGEYLLKKTPRVLGVPGMDISGNVIEPPLPEDFDLSALAGPGTQVDRTAEGEFIVASMDGFLNIDIKTNRITVTEKIVSYGGVSMRTTGDIMLDGEHFEEHGEIQEKRLVEGKNITVFADVFGQVVSSGGKIHFKQNLVGGSATNHDGDIVIDGLTSNALILAKYGDIVINRAENSVIVGKKVIVESAVNCTIVGDEIEIETSEGSAIAGKSIRIGSAGPRKENQTIVSVRLPDLSGFDARFAAIGKRVGEIDAEVEARRMKIRPLSEQKDVRNYFLIAGKLQRKEIVFTDEQKANWQKLGSRVAPILKVLSAVNAEMRVLQQEKDALLEEAVVLETEKAEASAGVVCAIGMATGDTLLRTRQSPLDAPPLSDLPAKELRVRLRDTGLPEERLLSGGSVNFSWKYEPEVVTP